MQEAHDTMPRRPATRHRSPQMVEERGASKPPQVGPSPRRKAARTSKQCNAGKPEWNSDFVGDTGLPAPGGPRGKEEGSEKLDAAALRKKRMSYTPNVSIKRKLWKPGSKDSWSNDDKDVPSQSRADGQLDDAGHSAGDEPVGGHTHSDTCTAKHKQDGSNCAGQGDCAQRASAKTTEQAAGQATEHLAENGIENATERGMQNNTVIGMPGGTESAGQPAQHSEHGPERGTTNGTRGQAVAQRKQWSQPTSTTKYRPEWNSELSVVEPVASAGGGAPKKVNDAVKLDAAALRKKRIGYRPAVNLKRKAWKPGARDAWSQGDIKDEETENGLEECAKDPTNSMEQVARDRRDDAADNTVPDMPLSPLSSCSEISDSQHDALQDSLSLSETDTRESSSDLCNEFQVGDHIEIRVLEEDGSLTQEWVPGIVVQRLCASSHYYHVACPEEDWSSINEGPDSALHAIHLRPAAS